jgi:antitoxin (DNA-binding transcriptional repressor) of toxin-antitoxin stability system
MRTATVEDVGTNLPELLDRVAAGERILILRNGEAVAQLTAAPLPAAPPADQLPKGVPVLGRGKGKVLYMAPDFDHPVDDFDWEDLGL